MADPMNDDPVSRDTLADGGAAPDTGAARRPPTGLLAAAAVWVTGSVAAFGYLDPIVAAFPVIMGLTALGIAALARDWDRHSTFEERELARARKRAAAWERGKAARDKDRARWEAYQARKSAGR